MPRPMPVWQTVNSALDSVARLPSCQHAGPTLTRPNEIHAELSTASRPWTPPPDDQVITFPASRTCHHAIRNIGYGYTAQRAKLMRISWPSERSATERGWGLVSENPRQASCILCVRDVLQEGRRWSPLTAKTANVKFITMQ